MVSQTTETIGEHPKAHPQATTTGTNLPIQKIANARLSEVVNMVRIHLASHVLGPKKQVAQAVAAETADETLKLGPSVDVVRTSSIRTLTPSLKKTASTTRQKGKTGATVLQAKICPITTKMDSTHTDSKTMDLDNASPRLTRVEEAVEVGTTRAEEEVGVVTTRAEEAVGVVSTREVEVVVGAAMTKEEEEAEAATTKAVEAVEVATIRVVEEVVAALTEAEVVVALMVAEAAVALMEDEAAVALMEDEDVVATTREAGVVVATIRVAEEVAEATIRVAGVATVDMMVVSCREAAVASTEAEDVVASTEAEDVEASMEVAAVVALIREVEVAEAMTREDTAEAATISSTLAEDTASTETNRLTNTPAFSAMMMFQRDKSVSELEMKSRAAVQQVRKRVSTFRNRNRRFDACTGQTARYKQRANTSTRRSPARSSLNAIAAISACMFTLISHASLKTRATG